MSKIKDTHYLYIVSLIREKETALLTNEQAARMIEAKTEEDAVRVLEECGYENLVGLNPMELEKKLVRKLDNEFEDIQRNCPDPRLVDVFRLKYDYHNAKVLVKSEAANVDGQRLMSHSGRLEVEMFKEAYYQKSYSDLPKIMAEVLPEAKAVLARTNDAQRSDMVLDQAFYREFAELAEATGSDFLKGYLQISIDTVNLRTAVRTSRMDINHDMLGEMLLPGGAVSKDTLSEVMRMGESPEALYGGGSLAEAAAAGKDAMAGGGLTEFEKLCDNALVGYLQKAKFTGFGEAPVIAYLGAVEADISTVRIVMNGRSSSLPPAMIQERLRDSYV